MVSIKYVLIVLRADDEGEGGTFAIYSLLSRYVCESPMTRKHNDVDVELSIGEHREARSSRSKDHQDGTNPDFGPQTN